MALVSVPWEEEHQDQEGGLEGDEEGGRGRDNGEEGEEGRDGSHLGITPVGVIPSPEALVVVLKASERPPEASNHRVSWTTLPRPHFVFISHPCH